MSLTVTDILKFRESESDPWQRLLLQANINFNLIYPVGSIYMSTVNVNPATLFGGTWEQLENRFLLGVGSDYTAGATGGEATHTLVKAELPPEQYRVGQDMAALGVSETWYLTYANGPAPQANAGAKIHNTATGAWAMTEPLGSGQAHNNMPPYLAVYMWKRLTLSPSLTPLPMNVLGDVASEDIVPISKGGTGADNAEDAITNLGFESSNNYCKMPDGTLMCWGSFSTGTLNANNAWGSLYETPAISVSVTFPVRFAEAPCVWYKCRTTSSQCMLEDATIVSTTGIGGSIYLYRPTSATVAAFVQWLAIGRWK